MTADGDHAVAALARAIRTLYFTCYNQEKLLREGVVSRFGERPVAKYDGGDTATATFKPVWPKIARLCIAHEMDPAAFVSAQFRERAGPLPRPDSFCTEAAVARYRAAAAHREEDLRLALRVQEGVFRNRTAWRVHESGGAVSAEDAARRVLRDRSLGLSALFRHCCAARAGDAATAAEFRDAALEQYVFQRSAYDVVWAGWIPQSIRDDAKAVMDRLTGRAPR